MGCIRKREAYAVVLAFSGFGDGEGFSCSERPRRGIYPFPKEDQTSPQRVLTRLEISSGLLAIRNSSPRTTAASGSWLRGCSSMGSSWVHN